MKHHYYPNPRWPPFCWLPRYTSQPYQQHSILHQPPIYQTSLNITFLLKSKMAAILVGAPIYLTPIPTTFPFTPTTYLSNIAQYNNFTEIQDGRHFVGCPYTSHTNTNHTPHNIIHNINQHQYENSSYKCTTIQITHTHIHNFSYMKKFSYMKNVSQLLGLIAQNWIHVPPFFKRPILLEFHSVGLCKISNFFTVSCGK